MPGLISACERALVRAAREHRVVSRQQARASARAFVRRHRRDGGYLHWVLRSVGASSALALALLGLSTPAAAELAPFMPLASPNPLNGQDVGSVAKPSLVDLDGDGDLDVVSGAGTGGFLYYENTGSAGNPLFTAGANPLSGQNVGGPRSAAALGDLDGDGDFDLLSGAGIGTFFYFENTGSATSPAFAARTGAANPLNGQDIGANSRAALGDLDADGDLDLVGCDDNTAAFVYYENTGTAKVPVFAVRTGAAHPLNGQGAIAGYPALGDLDRDGDLDFVSGGQGGAFATWENTGSAKTPAFVARTGGANPLTGQDAGTFSAPALGDLDGDGDPDLVAGNYDGLLLIWINRGGAFMPRTGAANPLDGQDVGDRSIPALGDLDDDGDLDLVTGEETGAFTYFANTGSPTQAAFALSAFTGPGVPTRSAPTLADLDADGDLDLVAGRYDGTLAYLENTGTPANASFVSRTSIFNPFFQIDVGAISDPALADLDGDADLDLVAVNSPGEIFYFENSGSPTNPFFDGEENGKLECEGGGSNPRPALGDIDGDGDADLVVAEGDKTIYCENTGSAIDPDFVLRTGAANPLVDLARAHTSYRAPSLGDLDADGDLDIVMGHADGTIGYLERVRPFTPPVIELTGSANSLAGQDVGSLATPSLADLDADGDADLVAGEELGAFRYFANTGTALAPAFAPRTGSANPLNGRDVGERSTPALGDLDGDGDFDLLAGRSAGDFDYFANTGTAITPAFAAAVANPFGLSGIASDSTPVLGDFDRDGDLDLAAGQYYGGVAYFENTGGATAPAFTRRTSFENPLHALTEIYHTAPATGDFDRDGDLDVISGRSLGRWIYLHNGGGLAPDFERRTGSLNPLDGEDLGSRSAPASADLNGDGTPDLVTGSLAGTFAVHYFPEPARGGLITAGAALLSLLSRRRRAS